MERLYVFLIRNDVLIYFLAGLAIIWYFSQLLQARSLLRRAMFGLEREKGEFILRRAISVIVLALLVVVAVTYVNQFVAPTLPPEILKPPTPTPNIFATPLSSPTAINAESATSTPMIAPTVTLRGPLGGVDQSDNEPQSNLDNPQINSAADQAACPENIRITAPPNNATVSGEFTIFGTATGENFGEYDIEGNGSQTSNSWSSLLESRPSERVIDAILATIDLTSILPGPYAIRLVVFDVSDAELGQCMIQLLLDPASS